MSGGPRSLYFTLGGKELGTTWGTLAEKVGDLNEATSQPGAGEGRPLASPPLSSCR